MRNSSGPRVREKALPRGVKPRFQEHGSKRLPYGWRDPCDDDPGVLDGQMDHGSRPALTPRSGLIRQAAAHGFCSKTQKCALHLYISFSDSVHPLQ